eukprot:TRINITY_DN13501_c0_g1_i1.p1 TRINITY_DN13501_c0_g1~~TRINITY_DN13501_c0_g1_i1.p1  ORF type:complete len:807 (-),score=100.74 TRINITY_DN13501_c0_g1_i1:3-2390(-)
MSPWVTLLVMCTCFKTLGRAAGELEGSPNCAESLSDMRSMEMALGMVWRRMVKPGSELPLPAWARTLAVCAAGQADDMVKEHMSDSRSRLIGRALNATRQEQQSNCGDRTDFQDALGLACHTWRTSACEYDGRLTYSERQIQEVRANCPKSCGLCGEDLGTQRIAVDPFRLQHIYRQMHLVLGWLYLVSVLVTIMVLAVFHGRALLSSILTACVFFLSIFVKRFGDDSLLDPPLEKFVEQRKRINRLQVFRVLAVSSVLFALRHFNHRISVGGCLQQPSLAFLSGLADFGGLVFPLFALWPERVTGRFGNHLAVCANTSLLMSFTFFKPHEFMGGMNFVLKSGIRLWSGLCLRSELAVLFYVLQVLVLCCSFVIECGWQTIHVDLGEDPGNTCAVIYSQQDISEMSSGVAELTSLSPWTYLITQLALLLAFLLCQAAVNAILDRQARKEAHLTAMGVERSAFASVLSVMCDCFIRLDSELNIMTPTPKLAALLLRSETSLQGRSIKDLLATEEDFSIMQRAMLKFSDGDSQDSAKLASTSHVLHVHLRDSSGTSVKAQIMWSCFQNLNGEICYLVGISENEERTIAPAFDQIDGIGTSQCDEALRVTPEAVPELSSLSGSEVSWSLHDVLPEANDEPAAVIVINVIEPFRVRATHGGLAMFWSQLSSRPQHPYLSQWFKRREDREQFANFIRQSLNAVLNEDADTHATERQQAADGQETEQAAADVLLHFAQAPLRPSKHLRSKCFSIDVALPRVDAQKFDALRYEVRLQLRLAKHESGSMSHDSLPPRTIGISL